MKYLILFCFTLLITNCDAQTSPVNVAKEYLSAIDNFDHVKAKKLLILNDNNLKSLQNIKKASDSMTPSERAKYVNNKKIYHFTEEKVSAETAKIIATNNQGAFNVAIVFNLKKVGNKWLINDYTSGF
ncbi:hypothetical protein SAMN05428988_1146 [Chitinophaga sp. YR573]|uniref:hypothetical protein n=1 Tax=Chitinophaga sp. YR573 TaxID=1881040 RepID=UPI0008C957C0|nr:hypothetical protein [Chitinophaga sp. YR573]SEW00142.1 hypothetical protein SAMN05428988_1146 [Chitinophaga sp. YR573]